MCWQALLLPLLGAAGTIGAAAITAKSNKPADPPAVEIPQSANAADQARKTGATVRVGDGKDDETTDVKGVTNTQIAETRLFGKPVGGLGKSGLSL